MKRIHLFRALPTRKIESLAKALYLQRYNNKEIIFYENANGDAFYLVKEGQVNIVKDNNVLRTISKSDYFGERSIILNEKRTATAISKGETEV